MAGWVPFNVKGENAWDQAVCARYEWKEANECGDGQGRAARGAPVAGGLPRERLPVMRERQPRSLLLPTHLPNSSSQWCI